MSNFFEKYQKERDTDKPEPTVENKELIERTADINQLETFCHGSKVESKRKREQIPKDNDQKSVDQSRKEGFLGEKIKNPKDKTINGEVPSVGHKHKGKQQAGGNN